MTRRGRFRIGSSQVRAQLRSSAGRRALVDAAVTRMGRGLRKRLVTPPTGLEQLEAVTNVQNWLTRQAVRVVVTLGIPDLIAAGVTDLDDLATRVGANRDALARLSRHLTNRGVFTQPTPSTLQLTAMGELLRSDDPSGRYLYFQAAGVVARFESALEGMMHTVLTGLPAYAHIHGQGLWQQMKTDPLLVASLDADMDGHAKEIGPALVENYDWQGVSRVADVGGGSGELLRIVLANLRNATGTVIEFADAARRAQAKIDGTD